MSSLTRMQGELPDNESQTNGEVSYNHLPSHRKKTLCSMKAPRTVKRITFNPCEANPGHTLYVHVPRLNQDEVIVPN